MREWVASARRMGRAGYEDKRRCWCALSASRWLTGVPGRPRLNATWCNTPARAFLLRPCTRLRDLSKPKDMASLQFWKPGTAGPGSTLDRATETEENVVQSAPTSSSLSLQAARERLPIFKHSSCRLCAHELPARLMYSSGEGLLYAVEKHGVTILVGQTGSGKTTRTYSYPVCVPINFKPR